MSGEKDAAKDAAPATATPATSGRKSFSVYARMVLALKRFEAAINPTYTYGKRHTVEDQQHMAPGVAAAQAHAGTASGRRTTSNRTISGRDIGPPGAQHGHKGHLLLRPLPEPDADAAAIK